MSRKRPARRTSQWPMPSRAPARGSRTQVAWAAQFQVCPPAENCSAARSSSPWALWPCQALSKRSSSGPLSSTLRLELERSKRSSGASPKGSYKGPPRSWVTLETDQETARQRRRPPACGCGPCNGARSGGVALGWRALRPRRGRLTVARHRWRSKLIGRGGACPSGCRLAASQGQPRRFNSPPRANALRPHGLNMSSRHTGRSPSRPS